MKMPRIKPQSGKVRPSHPHYRAKALIGAVGVLALILIAGCADSEPVADAGTCVGADCEPDAAADVGTDDVSSDIGRPSRDTTDDAAEDGGADTSEDTVDTQPPDTRSPDTRPPDRDGDGVIDDLDAFPDDPTETADTDGDGVGDNADACPTDPEDSVDSDDDGICDASDPCPDDAEGTVDTDGDGVCDEADWFPADPTEWMDTDGDGVGDNADTDDDGDGLEDEEELEFGADCMKSDRTLADTDGDGILDPDDPYPRDPFLEFMLRANDEGTIDLFLSNRDGTFQEPVAIGDPIEHMGRPLRYTGFSIGDLDRDGRIDFIAHSTRLVDGEPNRNFYFFSRTEKEDEFFQAFIGVTDRFIGGAMVDADGDNNLDVVRFEMERPDFISRGTISVFLNNYSDRVACVYSEDPADLCFFHLAETIDVTDAVDGEWVARMAFQAVNLNPDAGDERDLSLMTYSSGGNSPTDVYTLFGDGAGSFADPVLRFTHNASRGQAPGNSYLFSDFNGDGVGDIVIGFDDDGRAGEAWTYFGDGSGGFVDTAVTALDLNPTDAREESGGSETLGRTASARTFDFDFDGNMDLIVGYDHRTYDGPGQTRLYRGNGDGTFGPTFELVGDESQARHNFAIPTRLCPEFALLLEGD